MIFKNSNKIRKDDDFSNYFVDFSNEAFLNDFIKEKIINKYSE